MLRHGCGASERSFWRCTQCQSARGETNRRVGFVDVLTTGTGGAVRVGTNISWVDVDFD